MSFQTVICLQHSHRAKCQISSQSFKPVSRDIVLCFELLMARHGKQAGMGCEKDAGVEAVNWMQGGRGGRREAVSWIK